MAARKTRKIAADDRIKENKRRSGCSVSGYLTDSEKNIDEVRESQKTRHPDLPGWLSGHTFRKIWTHIGSEPCAGDGNAGATPP